MHSVYTSAGREVFTVTLLAGLFSNMLEQERLSIESVKVCDADEFNYVSKDFSGSDLVFHSEQQSSTESNTLSLSITFHIHRTETKFTQNCFHRFAKQIFVNRKLRTITSRKKNKNFLRGEVKILKKKTTRSHRSMSFLSS